MLTVEFSSSCSVSSSTKFSFSSSYHKKSRLSNSVSPSIDLSTLKVRTALENSELVFMSKGSPKRPTTLEHIMSLSIMFSIVVVPSRSPAVSIDTVISSTAQSSFLTEYVYVCGLTTGSSYSELSSLLSDSELTSLLSVSELSSFSELESSLYSLLLSSISLLSSL